MNRTRLVQLSGLAALVGGVAYAVQGLLVPLNKETLVRLQVPPVVLAS
jgi:hypothetical protein